MLSAALPLHRLGSQVRKRLDQGCLGGQRQSLVSVSWRSISGLCFEQSIHSWRDVGVLAGKQQSIPGPCSPKYRGKQDVVTTSASGTIWRDFKHSCCLWGDCQYLHQLSWKSVTPLSSPRGRLLCENLHLPLGCFFFHCSVELQPFPALDLQLGTDMLLP